MSINNFGLFNRKCLRPCRCATKNNRQRCGWVYLHVRLFSEFSQHSIRQSDAHKFVLNKVSRKCDKLHFAHSFVLNWNNLPNNVTASTDSNVFYKLLISHIVSQLS